MTKHCIRAATTDGTSAFALKIDNSGMINYQTKTSAKQVLAKFLQTKNYCECLLFNLTIVPFDLCQS